MALSLPLSNGIEYITTMRSANLRAVGNSLCLGINSMFVAASFPAVTIRFQLQLQGARDFRLVPLNADCAVCAKGFAPGANNHCHKCSVKSRGRTVGLAITFVVGALCVIVLVASYLLQPEVNGNVEERNEARSLWRRKLSSFRHAFLKGSPLSAVSIVVVVLQIIIQVRALGG